MSNKKNVPKRTKPYLTGAVTDEYTLRNALKFFFMLLLIMFMTFLVCSMTGFQSAVLRIIVNTAVELLVLTVLYSKGADLGEEAVARGEILYQHEQKGVSISKNERMIPYHPAKGFVTGLIGSSLLIICAVLLAATVVGGPILHFGRHDSASLDMAAPCPGSGYIGSSACRCFALFF